METCALIYERSINVGAEAVSVYQAVPAGYVVFNTYWVSTQGTRGSVVQVNFNGDHTWMLNLGDGHYRELSVAEMEKLGL